eukprot:jgi/Mesvir1/3154/Mv16319-RA.1
MQIVVDEGAGDAAMWSISSQACMAEMWPLLRKTMYACPKSIRDALLPGWDVDRELSAVRIAVKDDANAELTRWGARLDLGSVQHDYPLDLRTVKLHWRHVAAFLKHHPGIDIVILDAASVKIPSLGVYYFEYAVALALLHARRWLVSYPCAMLAVFPDRLAVRHTINRCRIDQDWFERPFEGLMMANSNRLFLRGPKAVYWGKGVDVADLLRHIDPMNAIDMSVAEGSCLCVEADAAHDVLSRTRRGSGSHLVITVYGEGGDVYNGLVTARDREFASVTIVGASGCVQVPSGRFHVMGDIAIEVDGGDATEIVAWGGPEWVAMARSRSALDSARVRYPTEEERKEFVKRFPVWWKGLTF